MYAIRSYYAFAAGGIALNNHQRFVAGADFLYEFGGTVQEKSVQPIVYFNLQKDFFNMYLGAFPRHQLVTVPLFMLSDTLQYYRPNVEGIYLEAHKSWGVITSYSIHYTKLYEEWLGLHNASL